MVFATYDFTMKLILCFVLVTFPSYCLSLKCYQCVYMKFTQSISQDEFPCREANSNEFLYDCAEKQNTTIGDTKQNIWQCKDFVASGGGREMITRGCATSEQLGCIDEEIAGLKGRTCVCTDDGCNNNKIKENGGGGGGANISVPIKILTFLCLILLSLCQ